VLEQRVLEYELAEQRRLAMLEEQEEEIASEMAQKAATASLRAADDFRCAPSARLRRQPACLQQRRATGRRGASLRCRRGRHQEAQAAQQQQARRRRKASPLSARPPPTAPLQAAPRL
jgi:hypothetical protein